MLHYDQPICDTTRPRMWAQHYVGSFWAPQRIDHHRNGTSDVSIVSAFHALGIPFRVVLIRPGDKKLERRIKQNGHHRDYCPECTSPPRQGIWTDDTTPRKKRKGEQ